MKFKRTALIGLGIILFAGGTILTLFVSSNLLWGEMEASLFTPHTGDKKLDIECPLMIAPWETATIRAVVTNTLTDQSTKPQVNAFISHGGDTRLVSQTLELEPLDSRSLQWTVDAADLVFERLILVSILQRPYRDLMSHQGTCSIYVYSLAGMNGLSTLVNLFAAGVLSSLSGIGLLFYLLRPFSELTIKVMQITAVFLVLVLAGLFSTLPRLWGLTLVFNAGALLVITVASVEILFSTKK